MSDAPRTVTHDDVVFPPTTFDQKVTAQLAMHETAITNISDRVAHVEGQLQERRILGGDKVPAQDMRILKLEERITHLEAWVHRLLNPNGDGEFQAQSLSLFDDPQDGL